jgi:hypothetical protein
MAPVRTPQSLVVAAMSVVYSVPVPDDSAILAAPYFLFTHLRVGTMRMLSRSCSLFSFLRELHEAAQRTGRLAMCRQMPVSLLAAPAQKNCWPPGH